MKDVIEKISSKISETIERGDGECPGSVYWYTCGAHDALEIIHASKINEIMAELYKAIEQLGGDAVILSLAGSLNDTLNEDDVLKQLKEWNAA